MYIYCIYTNPFPIHTHMHTPLHTPPPSTYIPLSTPHYSQPFHPPFLRHHPTPSPTIPYSTSLFPICHAPLLNIHLPQYIYIYIYIYTYIYIIHTYSFICVCANVYSKNIYIYMHVRAIYMYI